MDRCLPSRGGAAKALRLGSCKIVSAGIKYRSIADFADPRRRLPGRGRGRYSIVVSTFFPFQTALSALLRSWNPFRFLRRRIDRDPLLSVLPAKLSSIPVSTPAARLRPARVPTHRRADYHRRKIRADPVYAQVVLDSRKQWRAEHADYQKTYWRTHPEAASGTVSDNGSLIGSAASPRL